MSSMTNEFNEKKWEDQMTAATGKTAEQRKQEVNEKIEARIQLWKKEAKEQIAT